MQLKSNDFGRYWNGDEWKSQQEKIYNGEFDYSNIDALEKYAGTHPAVMQERIKNKNWRFDFDLSYNKPNFKDRFKNLIEKTTGKRPFDYKNYTIV